MLSGFTNAFDWCHMSLKARLDARRRAFGVSAPPEIVSTLEASVAELVRAELVGQAIRAGDKAPLFKLRSHMGDIVSLSETLDRGPVVISFFRGGWCPFCRLEMEALSEAHSEIGRLGGTLIGLSPLTNTNGTPSFPILKDRACRIAAHYRIAFTVAPRFRAAYRALGYPEGSRKSNHQWVLPLPATYIIDRNGIVVLSYVDADYTTRLEPKEIAVALAHLRARRNQPRIRYGPTEHSDPE